MTIKREAQICLDATPFYHCYVRCVRRAYLCGEDEQTGFNFDHRKQWIVSRLKFLSYVYAVDICAYAVMSNHYHVVLHVDKARALSWSAEEVAERWMQIYKGHQLVDRWLKEPGIIDGATLETIMGIIEQWRQRLHDISWFMRGVNETIARMANEEENCKGRFWEGRYRSQALFDEAALLSCMTYVDLNPVRAGMEIDLIDSDFTSIQQRMYEFGNKNRVKSDAHRKVVEKVNQQARLKGDLGVLKLPEAALMAFDGSSHTNIHTALPFTYEDYLNLVDVTGRFILEGKRGFIPSQVPAIISCFGIDPDKWLEHIRKFGRSYCNCIGSVHKMSDYAQVFDRKWAKGCSNSKRVYVS